MAHACLDALKVFLSLAAHSHPFAFSWSGWFLNPSPRSPWCTEKSENAGQDAVALASRKSPGHTQWRVRKPIQKSHSGTECEHTGQMWLSSKWPVWSHTLGTWAESLDASISHLGTLETETWRGPALPTPTPSPWEHAPDEHHRWDLVWRGDSWPPCLLF